MSLLAFTISAAFAQAPSGEQEFDFSAQSSPLIDVTGNFNTSTTINGGTPLTISFLEQITDQITNSPNGRLHGAGVAIINIGDNPLAAQFVAVGSVTGGGLHPTRVSLILHLTGSGTINGIDDTGFNILLRYNLFLNVDDASLEGSIHGSVHIARLGTGTVRDDSVSLPLVGGNDGSWSAILNILPLNHLSGTGTISLSNHRSLQGIISGTFSTRTGISRIRLTGFGSDKGFSVTFTASQAEDGSLELETVRGRILGQSVFE